MDIDAFATKMRADIAALTNRIDALARPQPLVSYDDRALLGRIAALETKVTELEAAVQP